jgi:hypothetical protein
VCRKWGQEEAGQYVTMETDKMSEVERKFALFFPPPCVIGLICSHTTFTRTTGKKKKKKKKDKKKKEKRKRKKKKKNVNDGGCRKRLKIIKMY